MLHHLRLLNLVHPGRKRKNNSSRQKKPAVLLQVFFCALVIYSPNLAITSELIPVVE